MPVLSTNLTTGPEVKWGPRTYRLSHRPTVADFYQWTVEIMPPAHDTDQNASASATFEAARWCANFLTSSPTEILTGLVQETLAGFTLWTLGQRIFGASMPARWEQIRKSIDLSYDVVGYDVGEIGRSCDCRACRGETDQEGTRVVFDPLCLYIAEGIGPIDREIAALDSELVATLWDRPYFIYRHALATRTAAIKRTFKRREENEDQVSGMNQRVKGRSVDAVRTAQVARLKRNIKRG
jgi:hypothetical protein